MIWSHFTTLHVNKYLTLTLHQLKDISYHFSTAGCLFSSFNLLSLLRFLLILQYSWSWSSRKRRCYRLNPSSLERVGDVWGWDICGSGHCWPPYLLEEGQSDVVVPAPLRVVKSGHTVDSYSETLFNPETVFSFFLYIFHRLKSQLIEGNALVLQNCFLPLSKTTNTQYFRIS